MKTGRRIPILVALGFAAFAASSLAGSFTVKAEYLINGSVTNSDRVIYGPAALEDQRQCGEPQAPRPPRVNDLFHYDVYRFRNLRGGLACVNVSLHVHSGTATAAGYCALLDTFVPDGNLAGSVGGLGAGQSGDFSYLLGFSPDCPDPSPPNPYFFEVIVFETIRDGGANYTLVVEGLGIVMTGGGPTATASLQSFRASATPKGVLVRWKTRSEHDALGFNLYRGDKKKVRLTRSMVRASGDGRGHTYSYLDRAARKGKAGPYYLEVVQRSGSKIMFGPARTAR